MTVNIFPTGIRVSLFAPFRVARVVGWVLVAAAFVSLAVTVPVGVPEADGATLYRICHRTNAIKNPYRSIRVAWSALGPSDGTRHRIHDGIVFDVVDPEGTHAATPRDVVFASW